ncbi:MAG: helix-turn-helix transcriptional regulator [Candidatus Eiseniibacteriota bacterium]
MNLSHKEADTVFEIMRELATGHDSAELRLRVGALLLRLLDAQYFASYIWDYRSDTFADRVSINMDDANLSNYERHYQFCDPITPTLQRRKTATCVAEIISRERLERSEFFNDFLARDGLHYGINFYAYSSGRNIGDLRIWRGRGKRDFTKRDARILDAVGAAFTRSLLNARLKEAAPGTDMEVVARVERTGTRAGLTRRQKEIAAAVLMGGSDRRIAEDLCISLPTVRTHIRTLYQRFGVSSRMQFARAFTLN